LFIDDGSPGALALSEMCASGLHRSFDSVQYNSREHPLHSNFGIIESLSAARTTFIVHLDDDVEVHASSTDLELYLGDCLAILASDASILGISLLTQDDGITLEEWRPSVRYSQSGSEKITVALAHPNRYFGTAACVIRRDLIDRHPRELVYAAGSDQTRNWEELVSTDPREFLVNCTASPFAVVPSAWKYRATYSWSAHEAVRYRVHRIRRFAAKFVG
jgi:hypothetical protein